MRYMSLELRYAKTWRIRKWMTDLRKATEGAKSHPNGLSQMTLEGIERDLVKCRAELDRRKTEATPGNCEAPNGGGHTTADCPGAECRRTGQCQVA